MKLTIVVLLCLLLALPARAKPAGKSPPPPPVPEKTLLRAENKILRAENKILLATIERQKRHIAELEQKIEELAATVEALQRGGDAGDTADADADADADAGDARGGGADVRRGGDAADAAAPRGPPAGRVVFVLDASGSMIDTFGQVRGRVSRALDGMRPDQSFAIVGASNGRAFMFRPELVRATGANVGDAKRYMADISPGGKEVSSCFRQLVSLLVGSALAAVGAGDAPGPVVTGDPARLARLRATEMPKIDRPVMFDTPEADAICSALEVLPPDNPWNLVVEDWPTHPDSQALVASVGADKPLRYNTDMAFVLVPPDQKRVDVKIVEYPGESDPGPFPVPDDVPVEGWPAYYRRQGSPLTLAEVQRRPGGYEGDRHAIVVDPVNRVSYEFFTFGRTSQGWAAGQASVFDLKSNRLRPDGWTSSDAAGLPLFPAVIRHDELKRGIVEHAMRVTVRRTRRAYVHPATHFASRLDDPSLPRMGERFRLRKDLDVSGFSPEVQAILKGLKKYGMLVADNGIEWAVSCTPDERIPDLHEELRKVKGSDFEAVVPPTGYTPTAE